jgi:hypothetical protein
VCYIEPCLHHLQFLRCTPDWATMPQQCWSLTVAAVPSRDVFSFDYVLVLCLSSFLCCGVRSKSRKTVKPAGASNGRASRKRQLPASDSDTPDESETSLDSSGSSLDDNDDDNSDDDQEDDVGDDTKLHRYLMSATTAA